jgi:hypothetical protein
MPATVNKIGPGTLTIGEVGSEIDVSCQVLQATVTSDPSAEDSTEVLCGDTVGGDTSYSDKLNVTMLSDLANSSGLVRSSWASRGTEVGFTFVPITGAGNPEVTGKVRLDPIELGGEVGTRSEVSFTLEGIGLFTVADAT